MDFTNIKTLEDLEKAGFKGMDVDLEVSLAEYGIAWKHEDDDICFIYRHPRIYKAFDVCYMPKNTDVVSEYDWIEDWNGILSYIGMTMDEFLSMPLERQIEDLLSYYGPLEIFGDSYDQGLNFEGIEFDK